MLTIGRFLFLVLLALCFFSAYASGILGYTGNIIIRQLYFDSNYQLWISLNLDFECQAFSLEKVDKYLNELTNMDLNGTKIIYIENWDINSCKDKIIEIAKFFNQNNLFLALNFDLNLDLVEIFDNDLNFKKDFLNKYKLEDFRDFDLWISYIIMKNIRNFFSVDERKDLLVKLREIFPRSKVGFIFDSQVQPTEAGFHPFRKNLKWDLIKPVDDDGDFVITPWLVQGFKRTLVISDGSWIGYNNGQIIKLNH